MVLCVVLCAVLCAVLNAVLCAVPCAVLSARLCVAMFTVLCGDVGKNHPSIVGAMQCTASNNDGEVKIGMTYCFCI